MFDKKTFSCTCSIILFALVLMLAQAGPASAAPASPLQPTQAAQTPALLQYSVGGHVLGFEPGKAYLAGLDHALTVEFVGGQGSAPHGAATGSNSGAGKVPQMGQVSYPNVWPGVEVIYTAAQDGLVESTYVVQPGARPANIRLKYNTPVQLQPDGALRFDFQSGYLTESAPIAFQEINGKRMLVEARFTLANDLVGFAVGMYDLNYPLTIDPTFAWHTFFGSALSSDYAYAYAMTSDAAGNVFITGSSSATWNGPAGEAPLHDYTGNIDIVIVKLNSSGVYQWHTFYGSSGEDQSYGSNGIASDAAGNVYITGYSAAAWNGPAGAAPLHGYTSVQDIVILKLNNSGAYQWHTFYGSSSDDVGFGITSDGNGNIYAAGYSQAPWNGPAGESPLHAYTGDANIVIIKLNSSGIYQWHTFYGISDYGFSIANDGNGNVYVTGQSDATWNGPAGEAPLHAYTGSLDIVIVKLNSSGAYQWHTFYGSSASDYGNSITSDGNGDVYVTGASNATWNGPAGEAPLHAYTGSFDIVIVKLNSSGAYQWHTFYGSSDADWGNSITSDGNGNIYVTGYSQAPWNGPNAAPLNTYVNDRDIVVIKLDKAGSYQWHAFYGSTNVDTGQGIASDGQGNIYIAGASDSTWQGPGNTTPLNGYEGSGDIVVFKLLANDEQDSVCANVPPIKPGYDHLDMLYSQTDIDPYKFEVTEPYTSIEATLTPPIVDGEFDLTLFNGCGTAWDSNQAINIGRKGFHIGGSEDSNIDVRFNVGTQTGTYYLTVTPKVGSVSYSNLPYKLRLELKPPNFKTVNTLILYNPSRFKAAYGLSVADESTMMADLTLLAEQPSVNGLLIQLNQFDAVNAAYAAWDVDPLNVAKANAVSDAIRVAMRQYMLDTGQYITGTGYVVLVGDDDQIPFRRLQIQPDIIGDSNWVTETSYFAQLEGLGDIMNTPLDAALKNDWTLSDNFYGNYQDRGMFNALPSLAVGRLVDTPGRIQNMLETYLSNGGMVSLSKGTAAVAGYDFLSDSAQQACTYFQANSGLTTTCTVNETFTGANLAQKFIANAPNVAAHYGHASHIQLFAPSISDDSLTAAQISSASFNPLASLWWSIGCHSGLPMPKSENAPLSVAQALADHSVTYIGNTGWAWGTNGPLTYSESLYQLLAKRLRANQAGVGEALRLAKQDYFFKAMQDAQGKGEFTFSYYDDKVMAETILYGLPMLRYTFPGTPPVQMAALSAEKVESVNLSSPALPASFHPLDLKPWNLTQVSHVYAGNTYYTGEQGNLSASPNSPLLPQSEYFNFDTSLGQARGVLWKGGRYAILRGNNPLVINPTQLNGTPGGEATFSGTYPLLPVALAGLQKLDGTFTNHLTFQTGQYLGDQMNGTLRLFDEMEFLVGLNETNSDTDSPTLGAVTTSITGNILHVELPITDTSGVYKAFVTYTEVNPQASSETWQSQELTAVGVAECTTGQHIYSLDLALTGMTDFFIQVMDCAGNVAVKTDNGKYYSSLTPTYKAMTFQSVRAYDGWVLESTEASNKGGTLSAKSTLRVGDDAANKQYRSILYFDTAGLPDNATITNVTLKIKKSGLTGTDPFKTHGFLLADIRKGTFGLKSLQITDFQALASKASVGKMTAAAGQPGWYQLVLGAANYKFVNLVGVTQFRLRFTKDDNNDFGADYLSFYAGDAANAAFRPTLIVEYTTP